MANHFMSLFLASNLLFIISAHGRVFQKDSSSAVSISDINGKPVSLQASNWTGQTNYDDVLGLVAIVTAYSSLEEENQDPCTAPRWTWIECNSDARPRIIALDLSSRSLIGAIPYFNTMTALQRIDFSHNALTGTIPSFLGTFNDLEELNVADNLLSGYIPDSIACGRRLTLRVASNAGLLISAKCPGSGNAVDTTFTPIADTTYRRKSNVGAIAGSITGIFLLLSIGVGIFAIFRHRAKAAAAIAAANAGTLPNNQKTFMPAEEIPMNSKPTNMSPHN